MTRQSLFERMQRELDFTHEYMKIDYVICNENYRHGSLESVFSKLFRLWKLRDNYLSLDELRNELGFNFFSNGSSGDRDSFVIDENGFFQYCELIINLSHAFQKYMQEEQILACEAIIETICQDLAKVNYCIYEVNDDQYIIVENDRAATAVAEITDQELSSKVIEYNHYLLRGDTEKKKSILLALADELEPNKERLKIVNSKLENQLFFLFNNVNIRHNNKKLGKHYQPVTASMSSDELENMYDETYQMALLAILLLDNIERSKLIAELIAKNDSLKKSNNKPNGEATE